MNTSNIKKVAPKARIAFMAAVSNRLNDLGIYEDKEAAEITQSGNVFQVNGRSFDLLNDKNILASRNRLKDKVEQKGFLAVTEEVAYTWFNRFCAIRYMELHDDFFEHGIRLLSHPSLTKSQSHGFEAIDKAIELAKELEVSASERDQISDMKMAGDQDEAIYRQLLLAQCHDLHKAMPFMFEAINDESELLLPENLTRTDSIIRPLIDEIPEEDWQEIEVIGWLYQFYIAQKKDEVIGKVVKSEDIPAATQLFTPNWIVKYLVQNSLGAKWLATYPDSEIKSAMEYYIEPAEQTDEVKQLISIINDGLENEARYKSPQIIDFIEKLSLIDEDDQIRVCLELKQSFFIVLTHDKLQHCLDDFLKVYNVLIESEQYAWSFSEKIARNMQKIFNSTSVSNKTKARALEMSIDAANRMNRFAAMDKCISMISSVDNDALGVYVAIVIQQNQHEFITNIEPTQCKCESIRKALGQ